jgi:hypothetical protein
MILEGEYVYKEYYIAILILAIIYYLISKNKDNILLSIIIVIIIGYFIYNYIQKILLIKKEDKKNEIKYINKNVSGDETTISKNYTVNVIPKDIRYLVKDEKLVKMIININFVKKFDKGRYVDLINIMDKYMKIYIYILSDRYKIEEHFTQFIDLRYNILEILYSYYVITPDKLKYVFGVNPLEELKKTIIEFTGYSRNMIGILENYGKIEKKVKYLDDTLYRPFNDIDYHTLP